VEVERDDRPGPNPLFLGTAVALVVGVLAGALAGDGALVSSNLVHRLVVGAVTAAVVYVAVVALWLAYHRRTFKKVGVAGAHVETGDPATAAEIGERDLKVAEFMGTTTSAIDELRRRIERLEDS
jgi:hypothetical protein